MEVVDGPGRGDYGEKMLAVVPFSDLALPASGVDAVFHTVGAAGRQRLAGHERPPGPGSRVGREYKRQWRLKNKKKLKT